MKNGDLEGKRLQCPEIRKVCHVSSSPVSYQRPRDSSCMQEAPIRPCCWPRATCFNETMLMVKEQFVPGLKGCCLRPSLPGYFVAGAFFHVLKPKSVAWSRVKDLAGTAGNSACFDNMPCRLLSGHIWEFLLANVEGPGHWISPVLFWH